MKGTDGNGGKRVAEEAKEKKGRIYPQIAQISQIKKHVNSFFNLRNLRNLRINSSEDDLCPITDANGFIGGMMAPMQTGLTTNY